MTSDVRLPGKARTAAAAAPDFPGDPTLAAFAALGAHAAPTHTRRGQSIGLMLDGGETAVIVRSGVLTLHVALPALPRHIVMILFPGDVIRSSFVPPACDGGLVAACAGEIWRLRMSALSEMTARETVLARHVERAVADQIARHVVHTTAIAHFDCDQRVATFFVDLALRAGSSCPSGIAFEMPLSRKEIADYLGLNADTLSRVMSRLKSAGLLSQPERSHAVIRDFHALTAMSPAARTLMEIHRDRLARLAVY